MALEGKKKSLASKLEYERERYQILGQLTRRDMLSPYRKYQKNTSQQPLGDISTNDISTIKAR